MLVIECSYLEPHTHEYPDDWVLGGADGLHPGADPRFQPACYMYYDKDMHHLHTTVAPLCDEQAIDDFTKVGDYGSAFSPYYLLVKRPGERKAEVIPWWYDKGRDTVFPLGGKDDKPS